MISDGSACKVEREFFLGPLFQIPVVCGNPFLLSHTTACSHESTLQHRKRQTLTMYGNGWISRTISFRSTILSGSQFQSMSLNNKKACPPKERISLTWMDMSCVVHPIVQISGSYLIFFLLCYRGSFPTRVRFLSEDFLLRDIDSTGKIGSSPRNCLYS